MGPPAALHTSIYLREERERASYEYQTLFKNNYVIIFIITITPFLLEIGLVE